MKTTIIVSAMVLASLLIAGEIGIKNQERSECLQWQSQAKEFPGYWITKWQRSQCDSYNIIINSEVR